VVAPVVVTALARQTLHGVGWNYASSVAIAMTQLLSVSITARIISPPEFGAYAAAQVLYGLAGYFALRSLGNALIRSRDLSRRTIGTATILSLTTGGVVALSAVLIASSWARAWDIPEAAAMVRLYAPAIFFASAAVVPLATLHAALRFRTAAAVETFAQLTAMWSGVLLALLSHDVRALVVGQGIGMFVMAVAAWSASRHQVAWHWSRTAASPLFRFATKVSAQNLTYFVILSAPAYAIGYTYGPQELGLFSRVSLILILPATYLAVGINKAIYPAYARLRSDRDRMRAVLTGVLTILSGTAWAAFLLVGALSPLVVRVLLGPEWTSAQALLPPLAVFASTYLVFAVAANASEALGLLHISFVLQVFSLCGLLTAWLWSAVSNLTVSQFLWLVALVQGVAHLGQLAALSRRGLLDGARLGRAYFIHGLGAGILAIAVGTGAKWGGETSAAGLAIAAGLMLIGAVSAVMLRRWIPAVAATAAAFRLRQSTGGSDARPEH
jgi:lipopolysaccharide exporter